MAVSSSPPSANRLLRHREACFHIDYYRSCPVNSSRCYSRKSRKDCDDKDASAVTTSSGLSSADDISDVDHASGGGDCSDDRYIGCGRLAGVACPWRGNLRCRRCGDRTSVGAICPIRIFCRADLPCFERGTSSGLGYGLWSDHPAGLPERAGCTGPDRAADNGPVGRCLDVGGIRIWPTILRA